MLEVMLPKRVKEDVEKCALKRKQDVRVRRAKRLDLEAEVRCLTVVWDLV